MAEAIFVIDDNTEFRESLEWLLEGMDYLPEGFTSAEAFISRLTNQPLKAPSLALVDVRMDGMSGLQLQQYLSTKEIPIISVVMTGHGDIPMAVSAMQAGAASFIEKPFKESSLEQALNQAKLQRDKLVSGLNTGTATLKSPTDALLGNDDAEVVQRRTQWQERLGRLTPREQEVLQLVCRGRLNKLIADEMNISIKTVELHRSRVMQKLRAKSITELIRMTERGEVL